MLDWIDSTNDRLISNQQFQNIKGIPSDVSVDKHKMGRILVRHCLGNQIVSCTGHQTVVAAKLNRCVDTQFFAHIHGLDKRLGIRYVYAAVVTWR